MGLLDCSAAAREYDLTQYRRQCSTIFDNSRQVLEEFVIQILSNRSEITMTIINFTHVRPHYLFNQSQNGSPCDKSSIGFNVEGLPNLR